MALRIGTSGFSYPGWKGTFYPAKAKAAEFLRLYAERLPSVELNATFYRLPKSEVVAAWAGEVPPEFRFAVKASQRITHIKRLKDCAEPLAELLDVLRPLGERLGPILFQLPPNMKCDLVRLEEFLALLPLGNFAFEFRHSSWELAELSALLGKYGASLVVSDEVAPLSDVLKRKAPGRFRYVRLRQETYSEEATRELLDWLALEPALETYVFVKHEVTGPALAAQLQEGYLARI